MENGRVARRGSDATDPVEQPPAVRWPWLLSDAGLFTAALVVMGIGAVALGVMLQIAGDAPTAERAKLKIEAVKHPLGVFAAAGAVVALLLGLRRQREQPRPAADHRQRPLRLPADAIHANNRDCSARLRGARTGRADDCATTQLPAPCSGRRPRFPAGTPSSTHGTTYPHHPPEAARRRRTAGCGHADSWPPAVVLARHRPRPHRRHPHQLSTMPSSPATRRSERPPSPAMRPSPTSLSSARLSARRKSRTGKAGTTHGPQGGDSSPGRKPAGWCARHPPRRPLRTWKIRVLGDRRQGGHRCPCPVRRGVVT